MAAPVRAPLLSPAGRDAGGHRRSARGARPRRAAAPPAAPRSSRSATSPPRRPRRPARRSRGEPRPSAAAIAALRDRLFGSPPAHVVVAPERSPAFAMPAAAWAARSGDPVLFAGRRRCRSRPPRRCSRHPEVPVYVLGPSSAISSDVVRKIAKIGAQVSRVAGEDPVANAIALARYADGDFGWNVNDPGHGFVVARDDAPARRRRRRAALGRRDLGAAAAHRQRRYASGGAARLPARRQARLHGRPDARLLQPRLGDRRPGGHRREPAG